MASCRLEIKAVPNAPKSAVVGWLGEDLKVKVHAPPVEGMANEALCAFLTATLGLPKRAVRIALGETGCKKIDDQHLTDSFMTQGSGCISQAEAPDDHV